MKALKYILKKYNLDQNAKLPIEIPDIGRDVIPGWLHHLGFKTGVEIGVAAGVFSEQIVRANPQMHLTGVDAYLPYSDYRDYNNPEVFTGFEAQALARLGSYHNYTFIKKWSMDALEDFKDGSLDFVYIDGNHEAPNVFEDIDSWPAKVRSGGIVAGHDYARIPRVEWKVKDAIQKYAKDNNLKPWFIIGASGNHAGTTRDGSRSWMFIKP
ncbi:unnamed protein product [marine sediment metagenome]|uniref:Class I SAM-dependent methyltransferase n=1 Tax=marine sediment metagenome TaxID=412755 RepID=X0SKP9_9ZZZZ